MSKNASGYGGDKRRKKHSRLEVTTGKDNTFHCQRERHEGNLGPAPVLANALGRGALSHSLEL